MRIFIEKAVNGRRDVTILPGRGVPVSPEVLHDVLRGDLEERVKSSVDAMDRKIRGEDPQSPA